MAVLISDYPNRPGLHCGSSAMRNLLAYYCGLELDEEVVFGLGSGPDLLLIESADLNPPVLVFGRSVTLEVDVARALGVDYREQPQPDDQRAWAQVRQEVAAGRPTMLSGDVYYLEYAGAPVHFPAHRFVLVGFDDDAAVATVADRRDAEPKQCSYAELAASRNPPSQLSTYNLWGRFHGTAVTRSLEVATTRALALTARRMLGRDPSQANVLRIAAGGAGEITTGLAAVDQLAALAPSWGARSDGAAIATYAANTFEKFGTGGGNFRPMYARFLQFARDLVPDVVPAELPPLAADCGARWTQLSEALLAAAASGEAAAWEDVGDVANQVRVLERDLYTRLGEGVSRSADPAAP